MLTSAVNDRRPRAESGFAWRLLRWVLYRLGQLGIAIHPYVIVREGQDTALAPIPLDSRFTAGFIDASDTDELVRVEPGIASEQCIDRFRRGLLCYAIKEGDRIVAKMWCDLEAFNFPPSYRSLDRDEAYLFNAYTDPTVRGHNLAPFMRQQCYAALRAMGRRRFYSYTDFFNTASRRFKAKLGAVDEDLCAQLTLFGRWSTTFTLRHYASSG